MDSIVIRCIRSRSTSLAGGAGWRSGERDGVVSCAGVAQGRRAQHVAERADVYLFQG